MKPLSDSALKNLSPAKLRQELIRTRNIIRTHRKAKGNARCWHNDLHLYERTLPDAKPAGRMDGPIEEYLKNCRAYIRRQQCDCDSETHKKVNRGNHTKIEL